MNVYRLSLSKDTHTHIKLKLLSAPKPFPRIWWQQIRLSASSWHLQREMRTDVSIFYSDGLFYWITPSVHAASLPLPTIPNLISISINSPEYIRSALWFHSASVYLLKLPLVFVQLGGQRLWWIACCDYSPMHVVLTDFSDEWGCLKSSIIWDPSIYLPVIAVDLWLSEVIWLQNKLALLGLSFFNMHVIRI